MKLKGVIVLLLMFILKLNICFGQEYEEDFDRFLTKFKTDESFQHSRLRDSIEYSINTDIILDENGNGHTDAILSVILKDQWKFDNLERRENTIQEVSLQNGEFKVSIVGTDNGLALFYTFKLINGLWYLSSFADGSD
jgi:hypothetical protein